MSSDSPLPAQVFAQVTEAWARQDYGWGEELLAEACARNPEHSHLRTCHAAALGYCGRFEEARAAFQQLLESAPLNRKARMQALIGIEWCRIGRHDLALPFLQAAVEGPSPSPPVLQSLADAYLRLRNRPQARETLAFGLSLHPNHPGLLVLKARATRIGGDPEQAVNLARQVAIALNATSETKAEAWHEMGHAFDSLSRYHDAFSAFHSAKLALRNDMQKFLPFWEKRHAALNSREGLPTRADYERWAMNGATLPPLDGRLGFLIGLPRSGTTLLERVLDAHPLITTASETSVFSNQWNRILRSQSKNVPDSHPLHRVSIDEIQDLRSRYGADMRQAIERPLGGHLLLDKNPSATPLAPAIARFFPEAKVLIALRDPRAVAWSCFAQFLPINSESAAFNRLETLGLDLASRLQFWINLREHLPSQSWRECRYESVVNNVEVEAGKILSFLDLPWDETVLRHQSNPSPVRSPSYAQASEAIYSRSLENWRNYEQFMGDVFAGVAEVSKRLGYE